MQTIDENLTISMKKVNNQNLISHLSFILLALMLTFSNILLAQDGDVAAGETLYKANCAACHKLDKKATGPALRGVASKYETDWLFKWIKNSQGMVNSGDALAVKLFKENNNSVMNSFPQFSDEDINNILAYTSQPKPEPVVAETTSTEKEDSGEVTNKIILGALALVLLLLVVMLYLVNKTLRKFAEENEVDYRPGSRRSLWKAFVQNQFLLLVSSIFLLLVAAYFMFGFFMQLGIDQGYSPVQPIHYSHKIHAGDNQIDCNYCHSSARKSKTSGIPSLNVCMNCHKNISEYEGEEDLENGYTTEFYNKEIKKLYDAVGWNEDDLSYTGDVKPVKWVRIHNLPDFAYFNHSQHVTVAGVECQTCHGPIEEMEIVEQFAPLTMGWCINCHKETNVNLKDNEYYTKIHDELSKKYGVDQITAAQFGGMECGKCHY